MPLGTPFLFPNDDTWGQPPLRCTQGRLSAVRPSEARRSLQIPRGLKSARNDNLEKRSVAARLKAAPFQSNFPFEAWLKPCPPDLASLLHGRDARAYIANRAPAPHTATSLLRRLCSKAAKHPGASGPCHQSF